MSLEFPKSFFCTILIKYKLGILAKLHTDVIHHQKNELSVFYFQFQAPSNAKKSQDIVSFA